MKPLLFLSDIRFVDKKIYPQAKKKAIPTQSQLDKQTPKNKVISLAEYRIRKLLRSRGFELISNGNGQLKVIVRI